MNSPCRVQKPQVSGGEHGWQSPRGLSCMSRRHVTNSVPFHLRNGQRCQEKNEPDQAAPKVRFRAIMENESGPDCHRKRSDAGEWLESFADVQIDDGYK